MEIQRPFIGVVVLVMKEGRFLAGKRIGGAAEQEYGLPGGHLEFGESFEDCAYREVDEEAGLSIANPKVIGLSNVRQYEGIHYTMVLMRADWISGEAELREPDRCTGWEWFDPEHPPESFTISSRDAVRAFLGERQFFDEGS